MPAEKLGDWNAVPHRHAHVETTLRTARQFPLASSRSLSVTRLSRCATLQQRSSAAAEVLSYLFPADASYFEAQKEEAAISRLYGGIHYRSDIEVGKSHGKRIGGYTVSFARTDGAGSP